MSRFTRLVEMTRMNESQDAPTVEYVIEFYEPTKEYLVLDLVGNKWIINDERTTMRGYDRDKRELLYQMNRRNNIDYRLMKELVTKVMGDPKDWTLSRIDDNRSRNRDLVTRDNKSKNKPQTKFSIPSKLDKDLSSLGTGAADLLGTATLGIPLGKVYNYIKDMVK